MLKIALGQIDILLGAVGQNFRKIQDFSAQAAADSCQMVLFPELWSTGYDLANHRRLSDPMGAGIFERVSQLAREYQIWIGGSMLEEKDGQSFNTFSLYSDQGELAAAYRKIHLFRLMDEHLWLAPGDQLVTAQSPWGLAGMAICYDLRFPEMFRKYATEGVKLVFIPAEWPSVRIQHWQTLLRARAIENQMFVVAVNRVGQEGNDQFNGHSLVVSPWGEILLDGGEAESLLTCEIDLAAVDEARRRIPILTDRRPDIYG
ncbi:MAG TPA: carbon-nitrogen family hydrolase [Anaerolineaceae bacterium]|nr:carbon-nitrogen family hydrolase [Anaerolineaceae bacterium]